MSSQILPRNNQIEGFSFSCVLRRGRRKRWTALNGASLSAPWMDRGTLRCNTHFLLTLLHSKSPPLCVSPSGCLWVTGPALCHWARRPGRWCTAPPLTCWAPTSSTDTSVWTAFLRTTRRLRSPEQVRHQLSSSALSLHLF